MGRDAAEAASLPYLRPYACPNAYFSLLISVKDRKTKRRNAHCRKGEYKLKHRTDLERTKDGVRLRSRALQRRYNLMGFLFASPWIIGFLCFTIIPISLALYYSFTNYNLFNKCDWIGLKNYADMFKDKYITG